MKRKTFVLLVVLIFAALLASVAFANGQVVYTWTVNDLGQGVWGGGPLFDDGTARGNLPISILNGQYVAHFHPESWEEVDPGESIDICFTTHIIKGNWDDIGGLPSAFCFTNTPLGALEVNGPGRPLIIPNPDPDIPTNLLIRVTPAN